MRGMFADVFHAIQVNLLNIKNLNPNLHEKKNLQGKVRGLPTKFKFTRAQQFLSAKCIFGMTVAKTSQVVVFPSISGKHSTCSKFRKCVTLFIQIVLSIS